MTRTIPLLVFIAAQPFAATTSQALEITVDANSVSLVLSAMESGELDPATRQTIDELPTTQAVVDKLISLGEETDRSEYLDSLATVVAGQTPEADPFVSARSWNTAH